MYNCINFISYYKNRNGVQLTYINFEDQSGTMGEIRNILTCCKTPNRDVGGFCLRYLELLIKIWTGCFQGT